MLIQHWSIINYLSISIHYRLSIFLDFSFRLFTFPFSLSILFDYRYSVRLRLSILWFTIIDIVFALDCRYFDYFDYRYVLTSIIDRFDCDYRYTSTSIIDMCRLRLSILYISINFFFSISIFSSFCQFLSIRYLFFYLEDNIAGRRIIDAHFRRHHHHVILSDVEARWAKAISAKQKI